MRQPLYTHRAEERRPLNVGAILVRVEFLLATIGADMASYATSST